MKSLQRLATGVGGDHFPCAAVDGQCDQFVGALALVDRSAAMLTGMLLGAALDFAAM
jgi:hypothetical protein